MAEEAGKGQIRQINEARILSAAERVFAGAGFGGATMAAIADQAALPKANLHYYFGAKRDLYRAVLAQTLQDWLEPTHISGRRWHSRSRARMPRGSLPMSCCMVHR